MKILLLLLTLIGNGYCYENAKSQTMPMYYDWGDRITPFAIIVSSIDWSDIVPSTSIRRGIYLELYDGAGFRLNLSTWLGTPNGTPTPVFSVFPSSGTGLSLYTGSALFGRMSSGASSATLRGFTVKDTYDH